MTRKGDKSILLVWVAIIATLAACSTGTSPGPAHSLADTSGAMTVYAKGLITAISNTSGPAYTTVESGSTPSTVTVTYHFDNFTDNGITINGSILVTVDSPQLTTMNGSLSFTGNTPVSQIIIDNITVNGTSFSGILQYRFTDGSIWSYDYATGVFIQT